MHQFLINFILLLLINNSFSNEDFKLSSKSYEGLFAWKKKAILNKNIMNTENDTGRYSNFFEKIGLLTTQNLNNVFDHYSDEMYLNRFGKKMHKNIHSIGITSWAKFVPAADSKYTGIFEGTPYALIRLSLAIDPKDGVFTPGIAVKFLIDGKPSVNFVAMNSVEGQKSKNFFEKSFSTKIPAATSSTLKLLESRFKKFSSIANQVGLSELSEQTYDLSKIYDGTEKNYPAVIQLRPSERYTNHFKNLKNDDQSTWYQSIIDYSNIDDEIYDVYDSNDENSAKLIGTFILTSKMTTSKYGDETLFFRHEKVTKESITSKCPFH